MRASFLMQMKRVGLSLSPRFSPRFFPPLIAYEGDERTIHFVPPGGIAIGRWLIKDLRDTIGVTTRKRTPRVYSVAWWQRTREIVIRLWHVISFSSLLNVALLKFRYIWDVYILGFDWNFIHHRFDNVWFNGSIFVITSAMINEFLENLA